MAIHWREASDGQEHWLMHWGWLKSDQICTQANMLAVFSYYFQPVAIWTTGVYGKSTDPFLSCLAKKLVDISSDPTEQQWFHQRLSLAVVRGKTFEAQLTSDVNWDVRTEPTCASSYFRTQVWKKFIPSTMQGWIFLLEGSSGTAVRKHYLIWESYIQLQHTRLSWRTEWC